MNELITQVLLLQFFIDCIISHQEMSWAHSNCRRPNVQKQIVKLSSVTMLYCPAAQRSFATKAAQALQ